MSGRILRGFCATGAGKQKLVPSATKRYNCMNENSLIKIQSLAFNTLMRPEEKKT
jgi:hypothetical protein